MKTLWEHSGKNYDYRINFNEENILIIEKNTNALNFKPSDEEIELYLLIGNTDMKNYLKKNE